VRVRALLSFVGLRIHRGFPIDAVCFLRRQYAHAEELETAAYTADVRADVERRDRLRAALVELRCRFPWIKATRMAREILRYSDNVILSGAVAYSLVLRQRLASVGALLDGLADRAKELGEERRRVEAAMGANVKEEEEDEVAKARQQKLETRALGTLLTLERVAIDNFRKNGPEIQLKTLEHEARNRQTNASAVDGMMEAFVAANWKRRSLAQVGVYAASNELCKMLIVSLPGDSREEERGALELREAAQASQTGGRTWERERKERGERGGERGDKNSGVGMLSGRALAALASLGVLLRLERNVHSLSKLSVTESSGKMVKGTSSLVKRLLCIMGLAKGNSLAMIRAFHCAAAISVDSKGRSMLCEGGAVFAALKLLSSPRLVWGVAGEVCSCQSTLNSTRTFFCTPSMGVFNPIQFTLLHFVHRPDTKQYTLAH
jgi:hypothetical protein